MTTLAILLAVAALYVLVFALARAAGQADGQAERMRQMAAEQGRSLSGHPLPWRYESGRRWKLYQAPSRARPVVPLPGESDVDALIRETRGAA